MLLFEPFQNVQSQLFRKSQELPSVLLCSDASHVIFDGVAFDTAGIEICSVLISLVAQNQRKCSQRAKVLEIFFGTIARGMQKNRAELQR